MRCGTTLSCVLTSQWCDGTVQCPNGEDEQFCVRLYGQNFQLQAYYASTSKWLPVCYDNWNDIIGKSTCQDIGYNRDSYLKSNTMSQDSNNGFLTLTKSSITGKLYRNLQYSSTCSTKNVVSLRCINCGLSSKVESRIVGGAPASSGDWPWQVLVVFQTGRGIGVCGGSIINKNWILTAAHCVYGLTSIPSAFRVFVGILSFPTNYSGSYTVERVLIHPEFDTTTYNNDIGLLKLTVSLVFNNTVAPVCLPNPGMPWTSGQKCWISGWGTTSESGSLSSPLRAATVPLVDSKICSQDYANFGSSAITSSMICAGISTGGVDTCQGDSGGPLVTKTNSLWWLMGDTSWGEGCARANKPGVYGNITVFLELILTWLQ
ncbi:hypothetical protein GDO86_002694, partial [Hymenochirus boettgeri]